MHRESVEEEGRHNLDLIHLLLTPVSVDIEGLLNAEIQATWFSKWQLFFVDLAMPMQANLEDTVEDDDTLYQKLIFKSIDADTSGPESTSSRASIGSKVNVPAAAQQKVQVVNSTSIAPDVVIEVEGTQQARDRRHVIIAIDNPDPDLEVKIVVRKKKKGWAVCLDCC